MNTTAQQLTWKSFPELPDSLGFAGMFAGVSKGNIFCMGGANFPGKKPWEEGKKVWYKDIFMFKNGSWTALAEKLPAECGYGVSISYKDEIILIGGNNQTGYTNRVTSCKWTGKALETERYPDLPYPLSNMCGALVAGFIVVAGGHTSALSAPLNTCLVLDLNQLNKGWITMDPIPGPGRLLPVCTAYEDSFYVFSGETSLINNSGKKLRYILQDGYCFTPDSSANVGHGQWKKLQVMPKGVSAGGSPLPVIPGTGFVFWGGVDAVTALWKDPVTHPGISDAVVIYDPKTDAWQNPKAQPVSPARVTLPVVKWEGQWIYISGELKPGIRTNTNYSVQ